MRLVFLLILVVQSRVFANTLPEDASQFYYPWLYNSIWKNVCVDHLVYHHEACSEFSLDEQGNFSLGFSANSQGSYYFDPILIQQIKPFLPLIPQSSQITCDFKSCQRCEKSVKRNVLSQEEDFEDEDEEDGALCYACACSNGWRCENDNQENLKWDSCNKPTITNSYFEWHNQHYFSFFEMFLNYCTENPDCQCYWPQLTEGACKISDSISHQFVANIDDLSEFKSAHYPYLIDRTAYGVTMSLFIHAFFYSHYHQIITDLHRHVYQSRYDELQLFSLLDSIRPDFLTLYTQCIQRHPHPKIIYEKGMVNFHNGNYVSSLEDIAVLLKYARQHNHPDLISDMIYFQEGVSYLESARYDEAVHALSKAVAMNPRNQQAYFDRAVAYFELGEFDLSLEDYLHSGMKPGTAVLADAIFFYQLSLGISKGICSGGAVGVQEYIPTILSSLHGLSQGLWAFIKNPILVSQEFAYAANDCISYLLQTKGNEIAQQLIPELKEFNNQMTEFERGEKIGYIIGKYGVEIFGGAAVAKSIHAYRSLKRANLLLTFEAMASSPENRALILAEAAKRAEIRKNILISSNLKISKAKQGKHIVNHPNYDPARNRSILTHPNPQELIDQFAGTGYADFGIPGIVGYKEYVNCGKPIGYFVNEKTGEQTLTKWGKIHYANDGTHIVPTYPLSILE